MSDDFNPYHQWLGIPEKKCPPTHYELLGLSLDEEDEGVIRTAAQRQRTHIEQFKVGTHSAYATQILYQLDEAELTLLNSELRRNYDRQVDLFKKRRKRRQFDPTVAPPASPIPMAGGPTVGEESGLFRQYLGIVSVLLVAFMIMAASSFWLPWRKVVFNNHGNNAGAVGHPVKNSVNAHGIAGPIARNQNGVKGDVAQNDPDSKNKGHDDIAAATIDATITVIDVPGRSLTVSRKAKISVLDVSRKAKIIIDGKDASLASLVPNRVASITFDPNYDVITKIEVARADSGPSAVRPADTRVSESPVRSNLKRRTTTTNSRFDDARKGVDLLAKVVPKQHTLLGKWTKDGHSLISHPSTKKEPSVILVPFHPNGEYKIYIVAKNRGTGGSLIIGLTNSRAQFGAFCSGSGHSWLGRRKGRRTNKNSRPNGFFPSQKPVLITCTVRRKSVLVESDQGERLYWQGDYSTFDKKANIRVDIPDKRSLYLGAWGQFEVMEMRWTRLK